MSEAEQSPAEPSLVEQARAQGAIAVKYLFNRPNAQAEYRLGRVAQALDSLAPPLALAVADLGWLPDVESEEAARVDIRLLNDKARGLLFDETQAYALNDHPFVRTADTFWLAKRLRALPDSIAEIAWEAQLTPVTHLGGAETPDPESIGFYYGYFDLDQQAVITEVAKARPPEANLVPISKAEALLGKLGLGGQSIQSLSHVVGFNIVERTIEESDGTRRTEGYINVETVPEVVRYMKELYGLSERRHSDE